MVKFIPWFEDPFFLRRNLTQPAHILVIEVDYQPPTRIEVPETRVIRSG